MKRKKIFLGLSLLCFLLLVNFAAIRSESSPYWSCVINVSESNGCYDSVVFGESANASDGVDSYDVPNPPPSPPPMVDAYFHNASQPIPHNKLMEDWKLTGNVEKEWTLLVLWQNSQNTTVTLTWNMSDLHQSEYNYIILSDAENDYSLNMLKNNVYAFQIKPNELKELMITVTVLPREAFPPDLTLPIVAVVAIGTAIAAILLWRRRK